MTQAVDPLQVLTPQRVVEEVSGRISEAAPTALNEYARVWQASVPPSAFNDYARDFWQRSVLFLDILRQRGNQREDMLAHGAASVLSYDSELVMRGDELPRPVNYSLLRVIPPEGAEIDDRNRPILVIDPRAGQGPGIGGFKQMSEIGDAFRAGHPVYFAGFTASPMEGQRLEDVARAFTIFLQKVAELHPEALGKPFVFGNCQAGWHAMMAACMRPDVVGPMVVAGAPLSYWGGVRGKNAMRYLGGWWGGTWADRMMSDMGGGGGEYATSLRRSRLWIGSSTITKAWMRSGSAARGSFTPLTRRPAISPFSSAPRWPRRTMPNSSTTWS
jgi:pimeloyl-ACP methyl ester carboxylesterase